jgi:hypothetical protein
MEAEYRLRNDGDRPLQRLELRLPIARRFHFSPVSALWDGQPLNLEISAVNPRDVALQFPRPWAVSASHTLRLSTAFQNAADDDNALRFATDGFFLPAAGWNPELLPSRGLFATGGPPPRTWTLVVRVPDAFLVHMSGRQLKSSRGNGEQILRALQGPQDRSPFVVAGRFASTDINAANEIVHLWTRALQNAGALRQTEDAVTRAMGAYDAMVGHRPENSGQLWLVECPVTVGCFFNLASDYAKLIFGENEKVAADMISLDTLMVDLNAGATGIAATVAPSLAASLLGYAQSPGFFEQTPPLFALPVFAAAVGRERVVQGEARTETIRRALRMVPLQPPTLALENQGVLRARSLLFFYGLQDRYGREPLTRAIRHMLDARRGRDFTMEDLIAALEQETHQNVAQFVRLWMKHPGVPDDFRARYQDN